MPESLLSGAGLQACRTRPVGLCRLLRPANTRRYFESGLPSDCPQFQAAYCHHLTSYETAEGLGHPRPGMWSPTRGPLSGAGAARRLETEQISRPSEANGSKQKASVAVPRTPTPRKSACQPGHSPHAKHRCFLLPPVTSGRAAQAQVLYSFLEHSREASRPLSLEPESVSPSQGEGWRQRWRPKDRPTSVPRTGQPEGSSRGWRPGAPWTFPTL